VVPKLTEAGRVLWSRLQECKSSCEDMEGHLSALTESKGRNIVWKAKKANPMAGSETG
jgi:hypothetical protein